MKIRKYHKGFSLLELVFVIVILGIVSSIGSTIIANLYETYLTQKAMHRVTLKTELAINEIANRLTHRIPQSIIARRADNTFVPLGDMEDNVAHTDRAIFEWIGYDEESFSSQIQPGWSGYCDTAATTAAAGISTPGSNLSLTKTVVTNLAGGSMPPLALLFNVTQDGTNNNPNAKCFGYDGNTSCIHQVSILDDTTLSTNRLPGVANTHISSQYKLAWSAYALVAVNQDALYDDTNTSRTGNILTDSVTTPDSFDIQLRYNYQPWAGTYYNNANTPRSTLIRNVTSFKYSEVGGTLRIKLCATERVGDKNSTTNVSVCKEKVVMR